MHFFKLNVWGWVSKYTDPQNTLIFMVIQSIALDKHIDISVLLIGSIVKFALYQVIGLVCLSSLFWE